jgi:putative oxidoreductase
MNTSLAASGRVRDWKESAPVAQYFDLGGRVLVAALFLFAGLSKIAGYAGTGAYMVSMGVPSALLPLVIATEVGGSLAIIVGWRTRVAAFLLAGFSLLAAAIFHHDFANQTQLILFLSDVAVAGGLLMLAAKGAGPISLDHRRGHGPAPRME